MSAMRDLYRGDGGPLSDYEQGWNDGVEAAEKALRAELQEQRDEAKRDAERYRWLRTENKATWEKIGELSLARDVDAAIDAARREAK